MTIVFRGGKTISKSKEFQRTRLLYYEDTYAKEFDAKISEIQKLNGNYGIILDCTAFYPTGGGQPADTGTIKGENGEAKVIDVKASEGRVIHTVKEIFGKLTEGEQAKGIIDWQRRYALMRNHTTAHLMAEALRRVTGTPIEIVGSGLNVDKARLDVAYENSLSPILQEIEKTANNIVQEERPVTAKIMQRKEAETFVKQFHESLKTLPPQVQEVRIIEIKDLHACACGGTHVKNTGEIGTIKVLRREAKGKGVQRIEFVAKKP
jgi:Ser-tRNA(Ala) deacylase AlaX